MLSALKIVHPLSGVFCPQFDRNSGQETIFLTGKKWALLIQPWREYQLKLWTNRSTPRAIKENTIFFLL